MNCMFHKCTNLIEINLSKFDTTKVKSMLHMFCGCTQLKNLNLSSFNTKNVQNMYHMFYDCKQLQYLDISNFDISSATSIGYMFYKCSSLLYLNLYSFKYHTKLTITSLFGSVPSDLKFCIKDPTTISKLLNKKRILDCCDTCFSENPTIDLTKRICTQSKTDYKNNFCDIKNTIQIITGQRKETDFHKSASCMCQFYGIFIYCSILTALSHQTPISLRIAASRSSNSSKACSCG